MSNKLPKHIAQLVEKNNLVMAMKTLAEEENISITHAKERIDRYEALLKQKQDEKMASIALKQGKKANKQQGKPHPNHITSQNKTNKTNTLNNHVSDTNTELDKYLHKAGYKKPLIPYWVKRVLIFISIITILSLLIWQL